MKVQKLSLRYQHYILASFALNSALSLQNSHHKSPVRLYYAIKKRVEIQSSSLFGCGGTRTHDQLIKSQLRYRLRHAPIYLIFNLDV